MVSGVLVVGSLAGCASATAPPTTTTAGIGTTLSCNRPVPATPLVASSVAGSTTDWNITSFDGTVIRAHWFPVVPTVASSPTSGATALARRRPSVLMGPGWSLPGDTEATGHGILGGSSIHDLRAAGYNVLTWDPRGFGKSTGQAEVDSAAYEAKDVSRLIDWLSARPGVQLDRLGDPRMGMVGASYGGGVQFVTAATDCRVDAIVPTIAWHSLTTSLDKSGTVKSGWSGILTSLATGNHVDPMVAASYRSGVIEGVTTPSQTAWYAARGPTRLLPQVHIPTLIVQGTVDTLFTLQEGVDNYEALKARGVTTSMRWFCGGHGVCLNPTGDPNAIEQATLAWLKRYVQRDPLADTGPGFAFVDQNGTTYSAATYPLSQGVPFAASGSGTLSLEATGGSGPIKSSPVGQQLGRLVAPITPAPASNAVNVPVRFTRAGVIVGAPRIALTYSGTAPLGTRPTRLFAQLVDKSTGTVLGNQATPIAIILDGTTRTATVPLEVVAFTAEPSSDVELQLVATTVTYAVPRLGGSVDFSAIHLLLPVASSLQPLSGPHPDSAPPISPS
jgi:ABC-2 type transport system ATP-binding protein